ncbi:hypothetical protein J5N97_025621 [Dioscorea zingiberensis]|uniref:CCHC-type domain-containing protein n=1 Tax=Dioscorea zingiberensis TaxID=325984 RepID=A0A9D5C1Y9_9LILI|nr:hypothetical protein J5N97_025621 [Dioscorea zingiberensis]
MQVCGQCLRLGHRADGCRRAIVCRRCAGTGHRAHQCTNPRVTNQQLLVLGSSRRQGEGEQRKLKGNEEKQDDEGGDGRIKLKKSMTNLKKRSRATAEEEQSEVKYNIQHLSVPLTSTMIKGKETLRSFSIATVTEAIKPFLDGRFMVSCPTSLAERELEQGGVLHLPKFSLSFEQWTPDLWVMEKADGERLWVTLRHLSLWLLWRNRWYLLKKPIGDLIYVNGREVETMELVRAFVRIRRGQLMPAMINFSINHRKHTFTVDLEKGEPPLPWCAEPEQRPHIPHPTQVVLQAPARAS